MTDRRRMLQIAVLSAASVTLMPACSGARIPVLPSKPPPTPDTQQAPEIALVAIYDSALESAGPALRGLYQRIRDEHAAHVAALGWEEPLPEPSASTSPSKTPSRKQLLRAERDALQRHTQAANSAEDPEQSQIQALIAASEAQHIAALGAV